MSLKDKWPWVVLTMAVFLSSLYEYGYWSTFHFNAFEYFSVESLVKNFVYILLSGIKGTSVLFIVFVLPNLLHELRIINADRSQESSFTERMHSEHPKALGMLSLFSSLTLIVIGLYATVAHSVPDWTYVIILFALSLYMAVESKFAKVSSASARFFITYYFCLYSWTAFSTGQKDAQDILKNERLYWATFSVDEQKETGYDRVKYLGNLGDAYAFLTPDNQNTFLVLKEHIPTLQLDRGKKIMGQPRK